MVVDSVLQRLGRKAETGSAAAVENDELGFEEDVAEDGEADAGVRLDAAETG